MTSRPGIIQSLLKTVANSPGEILSQNVLCEALREADEPLWADSLELLFWNGYRPAWFEWIPVTGTMWADWIPVVCEPPVSQGLHAGWGFTLGEEYRHDQPWQLPWELFRHVKYADPHLSRDSRTKVCQTKNNAWEKLLTACGEWDRGIP